VRGKRIPYNVIRSMFKRWVDIFFATLLVILLLPVFLIIALLIKLDSAGPVVFIQWRVGKDLKAFKMFKFRTMRADQGSEFESAGLIQGSIEESRKRYRVTEVGDKRITRVGRILRKTHLDETPQFFNVILGQMSLIGPRPDVPAQQADYKGKYWLARHRVRPGITGFSQLFSIQTHRSRLARDLLYIKKSSLIFDGYVFFMTIKKIFKASSF
jgi:lipopolysaccharide/colanic/teichoic acid biosynthesis glycosyltransferase